MDNRLATMALLLIEDAPTGRTALNKLLFFADIAHYLETGSKISNSEYEKLDHGPVPQGIEQVRSFLTAKGFARASLSMVGPYVQHTYALGDLSDQSINTLKGLFGERQLEIISSVKSAFQSETATSLSALSHEYEPWKTGDYYEVLDFKKADSDRELKQMLKDRKILNS